MDYRFFFPLVALGIAVISMFLVQLAMHECRSLTISAEAIKGKIVIVTGANSGLGLYTSKYLSEYGANVVMACRSLPKCLAAKKEIESSTSTKVNLDVMQLDLSSFSSIRSFAENFGSKYNSVDVLVNNAGIMALPNREVTESNLEMQIGTNHFGHFLLTSLLFSKFSVKGRIINHSSLAHYMADADDSFPYKNLQSDIKYDPWAAYGYSKKANLYFTFELNRRLQLSGNIKNLTSVAVHPGYTATNLQQGRFYGWNFFNDFFGMDVSDGSKSQILAAVDPTLPSSNNTIFGPKYYFLGAPAVTSALSRRHDISETVKAQIYLWEESIRITGESFLAM